MVLAGPERSGVWRSWLDFILERRCFRVCVRHQPELYWSIPKKDESWRWRSCWSLRHEVKFHHPRILPTQENEQDSQWRVTLFLCLGSQAPIKKANLSQCLESSQCDWAPARPLPFPLKLFPGCWYCLCQCIPVLNLLCWAKRSHLAPNWARTAFIPKEQVLAKPVPAGGGVQLCGLRPMARSSMVQNLWSAKWF